MDVNSRATAFLLAATISLVTTAFLSLIEGTSSVALLVAGAISFSCTFLLCYLTLEFLIFKEIKDIHEVLNELKNEESFEDEIDQDSRAQINPLKRINQKIKSFASNKQAEIEALKRTNRFRREFLADVSHELKTPIFAAQGFIYTLLEGAVDDKRIRMKFLKKAAKSLDGLDRLVKDLLTVSQMEIGAITMQKEIFDIRALAFEVLDQLERKASKQGTNIVIDEENKNPVFVIADKMRINQVITNLLENAIKYGREIEGFVQISFRNKQDFVEVSVRDNGAGIPQEHLNRVFERFFMVDKSRNKNTSKKGSGLGLSIVKHIIEAHGSEIQVESKLGIGTVFTFNLEKALKEKVKKRVSKRFKLADSIVFENDHYFIINKPISYSVLDDRSDSNLPSLLELAKEYNSNAQVCHRLDKETSGILVFSKSADAYKNLALQLEHREVAKIYHAIVHGRHKFEERVVELNLSHSSGITKVDKAGKFSSTIIETISVLHQFTLVECMPLTGRTHQIRAHLAYLDAPIVGDEKYGGQAFYLSSIKKKFSIGKYDEEKPLLARTALHAFKIKFMDLDRKDILAEAPYPKDFQASLKQLLKSK